MKMNSMQEVSGGFNATRRSVLLGGITLTALAGTAGPVLAQGAASRRFDYRRWYEQDYRIVQTNLREIDALQDPHEIARAVKDFGGNVIVSNIGGIVSFYPTDLEYHYTNPYLEGDFVGEMIEAAHSLDMAYLGRFDLAKGREPAFQAHPDWFSLTREGEPREYNGTYQACPSGQWAQDYALRILEEALTRYKPDGVFFNGYYFPKVNWYNKEDEGICTCEACRRGFRNMFGLELPVENEAADPAWPQYLQFQQRTLADLLRRVDATTAPLLEGAPIMGRAVVGRGEVQRGVDRAPPEWPYQGGEQARTYMARNPGKPWSATSATFIDFQWRKVTETPDYHLLRFAQMMGAGGHLDLYLMGTLADQVEPTWLPPISDLFAWRARNTAAYDGMEMNARIGLYDSNATQLLTGATGFASLSDFETRWYEYQRGAQRGSYKMLVDSRIPFQMISDARVADGTTALAGAYDVIYMPDTMVLSQAEVAAVDAFVEAGGLLIATGRPASFDTNGEAMPNVSLQCLPTASYAAPQDAEGWSLVPAKGPLAERLVGQVPIDGEYYGGTLREGVTDLVPFGPERRWGPPELNYAIPGAPVRDIPGVAVRHYGAGHAVHIPWHIDWQYYRDGLPVHQQLIASLVDRYAPTRRFVLEGTGAVELMQLGRANGETLLHIVNYAGQREGRYNKAPELHGLRLGVLGPSGPARLLVAGTELTGRREGDRTWYDLPPVAAFEAVLL